MNPPRTSLLRAGLLLLGSCRGSGPHDDLEITEVDPTWGDVGGGQLLSVHGHGFDDHTRVLIGDQQAMVEAVTSTRLRVRLPPGVAGSVDVSVREGTRQVDTLAGAFTYEGGSPLGFVHARPAQVPTAGGEVSLIGSGFTHDLSVEVGGAPVRVTWVNDQVAKVVVPPGWEGPADLTLDTPRADALTVPGAIDRHDARLVLDAVEPAEGSARGGEWITLRGADFTPRTTVRFGDTPAPQVRYGSSTTLEALTPPAFAGAAAITLEDPARPEAIWPSAFLFQPLDGLDVADVSPPGGPTFGGQRVTLRGQGFEPGTEVWFGEVRSPWVEVYHQGELGAVLPPRVHGGPVDVRVVSPRGDERLLPGAFTYALTTRANVDTTNDDLPYVVGAASIGPTTVEVNFSEPMTAASLASAGHYWIGGDFVDASTLIVVSAEASADGRTAILTTMAQSEINYTIVVSGVTTAAGVGLLAWDQLGGGGPYNVAEFPGTAETGLPTDTDGDGVSDALEQRGAEVNVTRLDGTTAVWSMTSDPRLHATDTDNDGSLDAEEWSHGSSSRLADTDSDGLSDQLEAAWLSSPIMQDSDGDGLRDGDEVTRFLTSPVLADTDGDQYSDWSEIVERLRDPRVADLPDIRIDIGTVDLALDLRYTYVDSTSRSAEQTRTIESSLSNERGVDTENSSSISSMFTAGAYFNASGRYGIEQGAADNYWNLDGGVDLGGSHETNTTITTADHTLSTSSLNQAEGFSSTVDSTSEVTTEAVGARVVVDVTFSILGDVAVTVENLELTLLHRDPTDPERLVPVAALLPANPELVMTLGPGQPVRGPFVFSNDTIFPEQVRELMRNPANVVVRVANFDMVDEDGRNIAYVEQQVAERAANFTLDFGNGTVQSFPIATVGTLDPVTGRPEGIDVLTALRSAGYDRLPGEDPTLCLDACSAADVNKTCFVCDAAALRLLTSYTDCTDPSWASSGQAPPLLPAWHPCVATTYGLRDDEIHRIGPSQELFGSPTDVLDQANRPGLRIAGGPRRAWAYVTSDAVAAGRPVQELRLQAHGRYALIYAEDLDADGLWDFEEASHRTFDDSVDSDGDELSDFEEAKGLTWEADRPLTDHYHPTTEALPAIALLTQVGLEPLRLYSRGDLLDSDGDCVPDGEELHHEANTTDTIGRTDPMRIDTDSDGVPDLLERVGWDGVDGAPQATWTVNLPGGARTVISRYQNGALTHEDAQGNPVACPVAWDLLSHQAASTGRRTNPLDNDSDNDGVPDGREARLGLNPLDPSDALQAFDRDGDGLTDFEENTPYQGMVLLVDGLDPASLPQGAPGGANVGWRFSVFFGGNSLPGNSAGHAIGQTWKKDCAAVDIATDGTPQYTERAVIYSAEFNLYELQSGICASGAHAGAFDPARGGTLYFEWVDLGRPIEFRGLPTARRGLVTTAAGPGHAATIRVLAGTTAGATAHTSDPDDPDTDNDGLPDLYERRVTRSNPRSFDTDGDQLADADEWSGVVPGPVENDCRDALACFAPSGPGALGTHLALADTDGDGLRDESELDGWDVAVLGAGNGVIEARTAVPSDPTRMDTDGEGLADAQERSTGTDPGRTDTDGDGTSDHAELNLSGTSLRRNPRQPDVIVDVSWTQATLAADQNLVGYASFSSNDYGYRTDQSSILAPNHVGYLMSASVSVGTSSGATQAGIDFRTAFPSSYLRGSVYVARESVTSGQASAVNKNCYIGREAAVPPVINAMEPASLARNTSRLVVPLGTSVVISGVARWSTWCSATYADAWGYPVPYLSWPFGGASGLSPMTVQVMGGDDAEAPRVVSASFSAPAAWTSITNAASRPNPMVTFGFTVTQHRGSTVPTL